MQCWPFARSIYNHVSSVSFDIAHSTSGLLLTLPSCSNNFRGVEYHFKTLVAELSSPGHDEVEQGDSHCDSHRYPTPEVFIIRCLSKHTLPLR